ncbi:SDR family NAD(P)-dependent oxidoreductase [Pyxidicoccus fallax]|uniref:SDR family NAD(P)-dependent oxidoreductase n=1 Tax=Pyxidicoccus fallax TaxID=394095 RepID=A0A848LN97_9BACT|nr:SDR family NAD(P)-dependent oxidoreductase [Pyxidicoccus fallax]NMO19181.1 SDR family NAD(P)-dependent oxidoreductase [Pyxidicoccus fallax]NPC81525.1 SDR family NAD(P)-dependent oxidoreductase [Pyxidicoccus fallax]
MSALTDQTVVIVGASSGIGLAAARAAAARGAQVVMLSRSQEKLDAAARRVEGKPPRAIAMNMLDAAAVDRVIPSLGPIDHLVLTAVDNELGSRAPVTALTNEQVERTFDKLRGFGQPEDLAHAIEFLMTNPYMTAHTLTVDGGFVAI